MEPLDDNTLDELAKSNPDLVAQYRAKMQGPNAALKDARDTQSYGDIANVAGKTLNEFGNANKPKDAILYNRMEQLGKAPAVNATPDREYDGKAITNITGRGVAQAEEDKADAGKTFNEEQKLTDTQHGRDWQDKSQAQTQKGWDLDNARNDPSGVQAKQAGLLLKNALLAKASEADEAGRQGVPGASDAAKALREQAKTAGDGMSAGDIVAQQKLINDASYDKVLEMRVKKSNLDANNEYRHNAQEDRKTTAQLKANTDMHKDSNSFKGNAGAQQASRDVLNTKKALDNIEGRDPNTLTTQDLRLLATAMAKIESGGVGGEHGTTALMPDNLKTKFAEMQNFLSSSPTDAQAGDYVRKNMEYLKKMQGTAQKTVNDARRTAVRGWKGRASDQDYDELMSEIDASEQPTDAKTTPAASDPSVDKYAKEHGLTYEQALAIKQARSK